MSMEFILQLKESLTIIRQRQIVDFPTKPWSFPDEEKLNMEKVHQTVSDSLALKVDLHYSP